MNERFPVLSFISGLLIFFGWLILAGGLLFILSEAIIEPNQPGHHFGAQDRLELILGAVVSLVGLGSVAFGESIKVGCAIEDNTRQIIQQQQENNKILEKAVKDNKIDSTLTALTETLDKINLVQSNNSVSANLNNASLDSQVIDKQQDSFNVSNNSHSNDKNSTDNMMQEIPTSKEENTEEQHSIATNIEKLNILDEDVIKHHEQSSLEIVSDISQYDQINTIEEPEQVNSPKLFKLVFTGEVHPEQRLEEVKEKFIILYQDKYDISAIERIFFSGKAAIIKSKIDYQKAMKLQKSLTNRTGGVFTIEEM